MLGPIAARGGLGRWSEKPFRRRSFRSRSKQQLGLTVERLEDRSLLAAMNIASLDLPFQRPDFFSDIPEYDYPDDPGVSHICPAMSADPPVTELPLPIGEHFVGDDQGIGPWPDVLPMPPQILPIIPHPPCCCTIVIIPPPCVIPLPWPAPLPDEPLDGDNGDSGPPSDEPSDPGQIADDPPVTEDMQVLPVPIELLVAEVLGNGGEDLQSEHPLWNDRGQWTICAGGPWFNMDCSDWFNPMVVVPPAGQTDFQPDDTAPADWMGIDPPDPDAPVDPCRRCIIIIVCWDGFPCWPSPQAPGEATGDEPISDLPPLVGQLPVGNDGDGIPEQPCILGGHIPQQLDHADCSTCVDTCCCNGPHIMAPGTHTGPTDGQAWFEGIEGLLSEQWGIDVPPSNHDAWSKCVVVIVCPGFWAPPPFDDHLPPESDNPPGCFGHEPFPEASDVPTIGSPNGTNGGHHNSEPPPLVPLPPWQNPVNRYDVNNDTFVTTFDVLMMVRKLAQEGARRLPDEVTAAITGYWDVNGDGSFTSLDVLDVMRRLRAISIGEAEAHRALFASDTLEMDRQADDWLDLLAVDVAAARTES